MQVRSPVGDFPLSITGVTVQEGSVRLRTAMGVWRSEVKLGREDAPLAGALVATWILAYALGRHAQRRR